MLTVPALLSVIVSVGAAASSVNVVVPAELAFPAASVAMADTETLPLPMVGRSSDVRTTATDVAPLPLTVLVRVPLVPVKETATEEPDSAVRVTTPPAVVASAAVAPPVTPVPRVSSGELGAAVSTLREIALVLAVLPAASLTAARN